MRRRMRLVFAAGVLLGLAAATAAPAADMAVKARPVVAPVLYNWSGCYIGANAGGGWSRMTMFRDQIDTVPPTPAFADYGREDASGFLGGGQVGCDFQTTNLVFGIDGKFDFGRINGQHNIPAFPGFTDTNSLQQLYLITGRIGYLWTPQLLSYVKVGASFQTNKNSVFSSGGALFESARFTDPGITAGGGIEYMFAPHWSVFVEANYVWSEADDAAHDWRPPIGIANPGEVINERQRILSALVGINYKFNWDSGPVVAKY
jgi:outer membrane immunogenic protein